MYNAELKSRFVKDYTKSINTANVEIGRASCRERV